MNAITTKYIGATNYRSSRIKATAGNGQSVTIGYPHEFSGEACHAQAALALCHKMGWDGEGYSRFKGLLGGGTDKGYAFVFTEATSGYNFYPFAREVVNAA